MANHAKNKPEKEPTGGARSKRIWRIVRNCYVRRESGEPIPDQSVIDAHPDLMPELAKELANLRLVQMAHHESEPDDAAADTEQRADEEATPGKSSGLRIRCPHCHSPVEVAADILFADITCSACGSHFSLTGEGKETRRAAPVTTLGHFELIERLGLGGFGTVWKARDTELDRTVAVKIPRKNQLDPSEIEYFLREARTVAQLQHPNIVGVHEVGRDGDTVYIVTDLVRGVPMSEWLTGHRVTVREAADLCRIIALALHHAHEMGVVHRDLKPQNIMIDGDGQPQLTDFGLARREAGEVTMTVDGQVLGTPAYMSPEQARGEAHRADRRSDIYCLGVILFELLSGELPFRGSTRMLIHQVVYEEPPSPRRLNSNVPRDLETICLKCLEKDPHKRHTSARELAEELQRFLDGQPIRSRPVGVLARGWRRCKRYPIASSLAVGLIVALVAGLAGVTWQWVRADRNAAVSRRLASQEAQARLQMRRFRYVSDMNMAQRAWDTGDVQLALELLQRYRPQSEEENLRGLQWYHLHRVCQRNRSTPILPHGGPIMDIAFSPNGESLATIGLVEPAVKLWNVHLPLRPPREFDRPEARAGSVAFSHDGAMFAWSEGPTVKLFDRSANRVKTKLPCGENKKSVTAIAFSPDDSQLAVGGFDKRVMLWDLKSGKRLWSANEHGFEVWRLAFHPDGSLLVSVSTREIFLWDVPSGKKRTPIGGNTPIGSCAIFSPDGTRLATEAPAAGTVWLWDPVTGERKEKETLRTDSPGVVLSLAYSKDHRLAAGSTDGMVTLWDVSSGRRLDVLKGHTHMVFAVKFSPHDRTLASSSFDGTVRLWDVATPRAPNVLEADTLLTSLAFSPDGSQVVAGGWDGKVRSWDIRTGAVLTDRLVHQSAIENLTISPDGTIATTAQDGTAGLLKLGSDGPAHYLQQPFALSVAFSRDGTRLAVGAAEPVLSLWNTTSLTRLHAWKGHGGQVRALAMSPNGKVLASGSWDTTIKLWDLQTVEEIRALPGHRGIITCLSFAPDGKTLTSAAADNTLKLWDVASAAERDNLRGHTGTVNSVAFSPDGKILASGATDRTVRLWYLGTDKHPEVLTENAPVQCVAFSPDGSILASCSGHTVRLWRTGADKD